MDKCCRTFELFLHLGGEQCCHEHLLTHLCADLCFHFSRREIPKSGTAGSEYLHFKIGFIWSPWCLHQTNEWILKWWKPWLGDTWVGKKLLGRGTFQVWWLALPSTRDTHLPHAHTVNSSSHHLISLIHCQILTFRSTAADASKPTRNLGDPGLCLRIWESTYSISVHLTPVLAHISPGCVCVPKWFRFQTRVLRAGGTSFPACC